MDPDDGIDRLLESVEADSDLGQWLDDEAVADELRIAEMSRIRLVERLRASGSVIDAIVAGCGVVRGSVLEVASDAVVLRTDLGVDWLVPLAAVSRIAGLDRSTIPDSQVSEATRALGMGSILRRWSRDRWPVVVRLRDDTSVSGSIAGVYADHVEIAVHDPGDPVSPGPVVAVPSSAVSAVVRR